jgi:hypothetical protein
VADQPERRDDVVASPDLLAFEDSLSFEMMRADGLSVAAASGHRAAVGTRIAVARQSWRAASLACDARHAVEHGPACHARMVPSGHAVAQDGSQLASVFRHGGQEPVQMFFEETVMCWFSRTKTQPLSTSFSAKKLKSLIAS